jgi:hypothetical protein
MESMQMESMQVDRFFAFIEETIYCDQHFDDQGRLVKVPIERQEVNHKSTKKFSRNEAFYYCDACHKERPSTKTFKCV